MAETSNRVKSVDNVIRILEAIQARDGARITTLANELELSKSTIHNHLATLRDRGYVVQNGETYDLGLRWLSFGGYARNDLELYRYSQRAVNQLAQKTEELALVSTLNHGYSMPLYHSRGSKAVRTDSYSGLELPAHCTASGKAMLAFMPESQVRDLLGDGPLTAHAKNTITDVNELLADLETTRERRFSLDDEERIGGMRGIGAPIVREDTDEVLGALAITGPTHRIEGERFTEDLPRLVSNMAREVEINIKYEEV